MTLSLRALPIVLASLILSLSTPAQAEAKAPPASCSASLADTAGEDFTMSVGLSEEQIARGMEEWLPEAQACVPAGRSILGRMELEISVQCDGSVEKVRILDRGSIPPTMSECLRRSAEKISFPSHDMAEGFTFQYAARFSFAPVVKASARGRQ